MHLMCYHIGKYSYNIYQKVNKVIEFKLGELKILFISTYIICDGCPYVNP